MIILPGALATPEKKLITKNQRENSFVIEVVLNGKFCTGVFTPSDDLAKEVFEASEAAGEKLWRMPLEETYWESMMSGVADMVNSGGRQGGSIIAALFLKQVLLWELGFSSSLVT